MPKHWNCFIACCHSNWANWKLYYHVPKSQLDYYKSWGKTDGIDWSKQHYICSKHWSSPRRNFKHPPDIRLPCDRNEKLKEKSKMARKERLKKFTTLRRKMTKSNQQQKQTKDLNASSNDLATEPMASTIDYSPEKNEEAKQEIANLKEKLEQQRKFFENQITILKNELRRLKVKSKILEPSVNCLEKAFDWDTLTTTEMVEFTGITRENMDTIFACFEPFLHLLKYEDCNDSLSHLRKVSKKNELLAVLAICRHVLPLSIVSWMLGISQPTMTRIFEAWITFGDAIFSKINLQPSKNLIERSMPDVFQKLGYDYVKLVLDATEFRVGRFSDLNLNTLFYSDYKQSHTVKGLVCLCPHGALTKVPDLFPGSITDTDITDLTGALDGVEVLDGVLTDKGFAISELAAEKGAEHSHPPMKEDGQFSEGQCKF